MVSRPARGQGQKRRRQPTGDKVAVRLRVIAAQAAQRSSAERATPSIPLLTKQNAQMYGLLP